MELKATLYLPCMEAERNQFIINYNHQLGYDLKFFDDRIEAWGESEREKREREAKHKEEFISHLLCTKRVLVLMLQQLGIITWPELKAKIEQDPEAQLEWDLCVELERCNPLIDSMGSELGLTKEQIDNMFLYANGIIDTLGGSNGE